MTGCSTESNIEPEPPVEYQLTISSGVGGSITTPGEGAFTHDAGTVVSLVASPRSGYRFANWMGDVNTIADVNSASTTIIVSNDCSITASFVRQYGLTISSTTGGSVTTPGEGTFALDEGEVVPLSAKADVGWHLAHWSGDVDTIANTKAATTTIIIQDDYAIVAYFEEAVFVPMVAAGSYHTVGLGSNGTVVAVGKNDYGQCDVGDWADIAQVAAGGYHTVGLRSDGTVVAVGLNSVGQCDVVDWAGIVQVAAGGYHTVGLRFDGPVVAMGCKYYDYGQCGDTGDWSGIAQVAAGGYHTAGTRFDGKAIAVGMYGLGQCDVSDWSGIAQVAAGGYHTVGLRSDGAVVAVGLNGDGQCMVHGWTSVEQITAGWFHTVGLKSDGTVVAAGSNLYGQCDVDDWMLA